MGIGRAYTPDVTRANFAEEIYIRGSQNIDDSLRLEPSDLFDVPQVAAREDTIWNRTGFAANAASVFLGDDFEMESAGPYLLTRNSNESFESLVPHTPFDPITGTISAPITPTLSPLIQNFPVQGDFSDERTLTDFVGISVIPDLAPLLVKAIHLKTGTTAATEPVTISYFRGPDSSNPTIWTRTYNPSKFPANSDIFIDLRGLVLAFPNERIFGEFESDAAWSMRTRPDGELYAAMDIYIVAETTLVDFGSGTDRITTGRDTTVTVDLAGNVVYGRAA